MIEHSNSEAHRIKRCNKKKSHIILLTHAKIIWKYFNIQSWFKKNNFSQLEIEANFLKFIKNNINDGWRLSSVYYQKQSKGDDFDHFCPISYLKSLYIH